MDPIQIHSTMNMFFSKPLPNHKKNSLPGSASGPLQTAGFQDPGQHRHRSQEETSAPWFGSLGRLGCKQIIIKPTHKLFDTYGLDLNHPSMRSFTTKQGPKINVFKEMDLKMQSWMPPILGGLIIFSWKTIFFFAVSFSTFCLLGKWAPNPLSIFRPKPRQAPKTTAVSSTPALFKASIPAWSGGWCWVFDGLGVGWRLNDVFFCAFELC